MSKSKSPLRLAVSDGNVKIGHVPNISLTPGASCPSGVSCFSDGCYAMNAYKMYPNVRQAWDGNLALWQHGPPGEFVNQLTKFLVKVRPPRFRWHVGGDIPDANYLLMMESVAREFPRISFLAFTKRYELDFQDLPRNLKVILSFWPGMPTTDTTLPTAWLAEDPRAPLNETHIRCPAHCGSCAYKCWDVVGSGIDVVVFNKH